MEFNLEQLNRFILHLFNETSTPTDQNETDEIETIELSDDDDNESEIETNVNGTNKNNNNDNNTKHFCFIIFNNPKYSHFLKNSIVKEEKKTNQQRHRQSQPLEKSTRTEDKSEAINRHFSAKMEKLIKEYMKYQRAPFSKKIFLDLTDP
ncbi:unnamed protein product [Rotaria magnacalcarata]|uniref:Uncharacterized protein n=1 Tax=Rotaria magnacalcarata TaxID=392030 RepID=A0A816U0Q5_9BILA|nr:unnamed protein product [Rotaria magnacalcarata]CAF3865881.1 unnamed protein product [Rotaria magnacalcarata]